MVVSLCVIITNTEIFHIFHIISLFNLPFVQTFHSSTWVSSIFSLSFHNFLLYFPNLITIQLGFVPYFNLGFFHIFHIFSLFNLPFFHIFPIFSLFNLLFFCIFQIFPLFNLLFFVVYSLTYTTHSMIFST